MEHLGAVRCLTLLRAGELPEKRAARGCKRPKSREETPKEGGGNAMRSRCRAAAICHRGAQKASPESRAPQVSGMRCKIATAAGPNVMEWTILHGRLPSGSRSDRPDAGQESFP